MKVDGEAREIKKDLYYRISSMPMKIAKEKRSVKVANPKT
jgi:hypothetical protein